MKKLFALLVFVSLPALGAPFLVTNPVTGTVCTMYMDAVPGVTVPVVVATAPAIGNMCQFDLALLAAGAHSVTVTTTTLPDPIWGGGGESVKSLPLAFVRPPLSGLPAAPSGLRLTL